MSTTTFHRNPASDPALQSLIARMYVESLADTPTCRTAQGWREQLAYLLQQHGREVVIEALMESVQGLSVRDAVRLADMAERAESGQMATV